MANKSKEQPSAGFHPPFTAMRTRLSWALSPVYLPKRTTSQRSAAIAGNSFVGGNILSLQASHRMIQEPLACMKLWQCWKWQVGCKEAVLCTDLRADACDCCLPSPSAAGELAPRLGALWEALWSGLCLPPCSATPGHSPTPHAAGVLTKGMRRCGVALLAMAARCSRPLTIEGGALH